jgi:transposase, IS30 family
VFWRLVASGVSVSDAAAGAGVSRSGAQKWFRNAGGVIPQHVLVEPSGRYLSGLDRSTIMVGLAQGMSVRAIAGLIGRAPSTVSREIRRNRSARGGYQAARAELWAQRRRARPKPSKLARDPVLREWVQSGLVARWSPEQISRRLVVEFPTQERMRVSAETIYQSIYVQGRGSLRRQVEVRVRTGRTLRKPRRQHAADRRRMGARFPGMVLISDRPAEIEDRAVPGHWEGDLIVGTDGKSQIGTLVERSTRYCLLLHLPGSKEANVVADAMIATIRALPGPLIRSITWDQGIELAAHPKITLATEVEIYFCDPHSPWQRGTNENTNGLLRQYFPKGTDLSIHSAEHLAFVAAELNGRPRKTLDWRTPTEAFEQLLLTTQEQTGVATTP